MRRWRLWLPLAAFAALLAVVGFRVGKPEAPLPSPLVGKPLPAFSLPLLEGEGRLNSADFAGRAVLVNVFGSWCVACVEEHPVLLEAARSAEIVGIAWRDKPEDTRAWLAKRGNPYRAVGVDADSRAVLDLGVTGAPETFVVGPDGRVAFKLTGVMTPEIWRDRIRPLLESLK